MRRLLDRIYLACGVLGAVFLAAIAVLIFSQIIARSLDLFIPAANDFAGFCLAASSFLALAYTFRAGSHIRVTLLLQRLPPRWRRGFDLASLAVAALMIGYFAWYAVALVGDSLHFGDLSEGLVPVALWIPQSAMALGLIVLTLALVDEFVAVLRGQQPSYDQALDIVLGEPASED